MGGAHLRVYHDLRKDTLKAAFQSPQVTGASSLPQGIYVVVVTVVCMCAFYVYVCVRGGRSILSLALWQGVRMV